jgi:hypothetical protein
MLKHLSLFCLALMLITAPSLYAADPPPAQDELKQLFAAGNYKELLPKLSKALAVKGPDAAQYDKYQLLIMKGEASLQTHSRQAAADAFKQAGAAAAKPDDAAAAFGTADLVLQANGALKYLPRVKSTRDEKPQPIDIIDTSSRKLALEALETDMAARVKIKVDAVIAGTSLPQIMTTLKDRDLTDLKNVEMAAGGSTPDSTQMIGDLGARAAALMDAALDKMAEELHTDVDAVNNRNGSAAPAKPGTTNALMTISQFMQNMNTINTNARAIGDFATSLKGVIGEGTDLKPVMEKSTEVQAAAKQFIQQAKKAGA